MFGKKKCNQCGTVLEEGAIKQSGGAFCSENCAKEYSKSEDKHGRCCC